MESTCNSDIIELNSNTSDITKQRNENEKISKSVGETVVLEELNDHNYEKSCAEEYNDHNYETSCDSKNDRKRKHISDDYNLIESETAPSNQTGLEKLPIEMLSEIIKYLPLQERKSAKLVCKEWYHICNRISFLLSEKLVCFGLYSINQILDVLTNSDRPYFNLEFHYLQFTSDFLPFWKKCGKKIYSIEFHDCVLDEDNVKDMIIHCEELLHLSWIFVERLFEEALAKEPLCSNNTIVYLMENKIIRKKLISLKIQKVNCDKLCNYKFYGIFTIYPNIRRLEFSGHEVRHSFKSTEMRSEDLLSTEKFTFGCFLYKLILSSDVMEKIFFDFGGSTFLNIISYPYEIIMSIPGLLRLKELTFRVVVETWPNKRIIDFIVKQKNLQSLRLFITFTETSDDMSNFLLLLLDSCPNLRHLEFETNKMSMHNELFRKLSSSRLQSLKIDCYSVQLQKKNAFENLGINYTLRSVMMPKCLTERKGSENIALELIKMFRNLEYLYVSGEMGETDCLLLPICKFQPNLDGLVLKSCQFFPSASCAIKEELKNSRFYSLRRLEKLKYLKIEACHQMIPWACELITSYFPNLRYLDITRLQHSSDVYLHCNLDLLSLCKLPLLEGLLLNFEKNHYAPLIELCKKLTKLRYLFLLGKDNIPLLETQYDCILASCPSLRLFNHTSVRRKDFKVAYYYDVMTKQMTKKTSNELYPWRRISYDFFTVEQWSF